MIGAGSLDTRCTFQKETQVSDGGGGHTITWVDQFTVWGRIDYPSMRSRMEQIAAGAVQTPVAAELMVRDTSQTRLAKKEWRMVMATDQSVSPTVFETFNIRKVYPRQRDGFLRFEVEAGVPT